MKYSCGYLTLISFSSIALAQLEAIPSCAQKCFSAALDKTNCIFEGVLDPACACTSYSLSLTNGGHMTGIDYAIQLCGLIEEACDGKDSDAMEKAFDGICYNNDASPKYNCGVLPGSPAPPTLSVTPTGSVVQTWNDGYLATMPVYPKYTTVMVTTMVYKHTTFTEPYAWTTKIEVTDYPLYAAVCPVRMTVGIPFSYTASRISVVYTTSSVNEYAALTAAAASASRASVLAAQVTTTTSGTSLSTAVSSSGVMVTGAVNGTTTGTRTGSAAPASTTVSKAGAGRLGSGSGVLGLAMVALGLMGFL